MLARVWFGTCPPTEQYTDCTDQYTDCTDKYTDRTHQYTDCTDQYRDGEVVVVVVSS